MRRVLKFLIQAYRVGISPMFAPSCRFHPSCSEYSLEAIDKHGSLSGTVLSIKRICRCHPYHPGGYDPVP